MVGRMKKPALVAEAIGIGIVIGVLAGIQFSSDPEAAPVEEELTVEEVATIVPIDPISSLPRPPDSRLVNTGFNPMIHGFSFANWAGLSKRDAMSYDHLVELVGASARCDEERQSCELRGGREISLEHINEHLAAGRCEGMIVLSALLFSGLYDIGQFGTDATTAIELKRDVAADEIARWWATQLSPELQLFSAGKRKLRPHEVAREVQVLMENRIMVSMGIYADGIAHTVLPFAALIEPEKTTFLVYDPNFPLETKQLIVDFATDVWVYSDAYRANGSIGNLSENQRGSIDYINITARETAGGWQDLVDF